MTHLPLVMARQLSHHSAKLAKMPVRTHAEVGQVEPVLDGKANLDYIKPHSFTFELLT